MTWVEGRVVAKHHWTDRLVSLQVDAPVQDYAAGQFTKLGLDIDGERVGRPYSYVNPPHQRPLEFYFITVPDGPLTTRMVALEPGDAIWVQAKAAGLFTLEQLPKARYLWLLATGTALGVYLSILNTDAPWQRFERIVLVHGVRTAKELTYREKIHTLCREHPEQLQSLACVSREQPGEAIHGRITDTLASGALEQAAGLALSAETAQVMICGNQDMVRDVTGLLEQRRLRRNRRKEAGHFTTEKYF